MRCLGWRNRHEGERPGGPAHANGVHKNTKFLVGDTVFYDVRAAAAAGLSPLLHDPYGIHRADPHPSGPHRLLPDLNSLLDLV